MTRQHNEQRLQSIETALEEVEERASFWDMQHEDYHKTNERWVKLLNERAKLKREIQANMHNSYSKGK